MIRKPAHKDTKNPPGQIVNPFPPEIVYDPVEHNMKQWKAWEESKRVLEKRLEGNPLDRRAHHALQDLERTKPPDS